MRLSKRSFLSLLGRVTLIIFIMPLSVEIGLSYPVDDSYRSEDINWDERIDKLLEVEKGDIIVTAVGDMIFTREISGYEEPEYQNIYRVMQDAHIAYGNLEMSLNEKPEEQRGTYDFRRERDFAWEIAKIGINLVSLGNNHQFDYGPEGLKDCLKILKRSGIGFAGAGLNPQEAVAPDKRQIYMTKFAFLSNYSASWGVKHSSEGPVIATIYAPEVLIEQENGTTKTIRAPVEEDVKAMEDRIVLAKRHADFVMVHFHVHWVEHARAYDLPDKVPPNQTPVFHRAIDAGADVILGNGPHVLRGIEIYKGKPILYSQGNFIYQWKTPNKIPAIVFSRDQESLSGYEDTAPSLRGQDPREEAETFLARFTIRKKKVHRIDLIPVTLHVAGERMGSPRLADNKRGREIIELLQTLSKKYGTRITHKDWYGIIDMAND
ncbi:MAG: CapA family protein [Candidatus Aminicenantes bacterium]|nr:CapA family protein [Candidatus Aminicenantes bacterium]